MNRVCHPYWNWEDYQNGFWDDCNCDTKISLSEILLCDHYKLKIVMESVLEMWPTSSEHNLTNLEINRRAWLGQAACCIEHQAPEHITRIAWGNISEIDKFRANKVADSVIELFEISYDFIKINQLKLF